MARPIGIPNDRRPIDTGDLAWMDDARCRGVDPDVMFPPPGRPDLELAAKRLCAQCPVRAACLEYALATPSNHGIFGGYNARERARLRRGQAPHVRTGRPRKS